MKKFLVFLLVSVLFLSISVSAENRDDRYALYTKEDTFMPLRIKAKNIQKSSKRITFQSAEPADSATYILDESTAYEDVEQEAEKGLSAFISGEKTEITVYIPKCQYYLFSLKREAEVSVSAVPSFNKELDVSLPDNTNPFVVLEAFSILEENADRSAYVSRGKMAEMLIRAHRIDASTVSLEPHEPFSDVSAKNPFHLSVRVAQAIGILNGYGDGTFRPNAEITGPECIKTVVALLGYTPLAEARGGYPNGYMQVAAQIGLTKGITLPVASPVTLDTAASLLKNALYLPDMVQTVYKQDAAEYDVMDGTNGKPYIRFYDRYYRY